jgi:hypothetical protein
MDGNPLAGGQFHAVGFRHKKSVSEPGPQLKPAVCRRVDPGALRHTVPIATMPDRRVWILCENLNWVVRATGPSRPATRRAEWRGVFPLKFRPKCARSSSRQPERAGRPFHPGFRTSREVCTSATMFQCENSLDCRANSGGGDIGAGTAASPVLSGVSAI